MPSVRIEYVPSDWARTPELDAQLYDILYRDFGVAPDAAWRHQGESHGTLAVALSDDEALLGSARLLAGPEGGPRQVRQLAVAEHARRIGVGRELMHALEEVAAASRAESIWLNARESAYAFYEGLGYTFAGVTFESDLTGIPHRRMVKELSATSG